MLFRSGVLRVHTHAANRVDGVSIRVFDHLARPTNPSLWRWAAAGLVALEEGPKRLHIDHENTQFLANRLAAMRGIDLDVSKVQTNIVIFSVKPSGLSSAEFLQKVSAQGVLAVPVDEFRVRMVTHLDVSRGDIEKALEIIGSVVNC